MSYGGQRRADNSQLLHAVRFCNVTRVKKDNQFKLGANDGLIREVSPQIFMRYSWNICAAAQLVAREEVDKPKV